MLAHAVSRARTSSTATQIGLPSDSVLHLHLSSPAGSTSALLSVLFSFAGVGILGTVSRTVVIYTLCINLVKIISVRFDRDIYQYRHHRLIDIEDFIFRCSVGS